MVGRNNAVMKWILLAVLFVAIILAFNHQTLHNNMSREVPETSEMTGKNQKKSDDSKSFSIQPKTQTTIRINVEAYPLSFENAKERDPRLESTTHDNKQHDDAPESAPANTSHHFVNYPQSNRLMDPFCISTLKPIFGDSPLKIPKYLNFSKEVLACMYHRYITTIQEFCVEPKSFGNPDNGGGFVCVDNDLLRKGNCRVVLFGAASNGPYMTHMENQYGCHINSYSGGKTFELHREVSKWMANEKDIADNIDVIMFNLTMSSKDVLTVNKLLQKESIISRIRQIGIKIYSDPDIMTDEGYRERLQMFHNIYRKGFRIFFYERDWSCLPSNTTNYQFLKCYSVYFIKPQKIVPQQITIPTNEILNKMTSEEILRLYDRFLSSFHIMCQQNIRFGNIKDGGWNVCHDWKYRPKPPCLIYSIGIANDWSFDEQVSRTYGCKIYSFDPSINLPNHQHSSKVWFYNVGIGGNNFVNKQNWTIMTLDAIANMLQHNEQVIDIVKMDAEGAEWDSIQQMVNSGILNRVKQLYLEFHSAHSPDRLALVRQLYDVGFRIFWTHKNPWHLNFMPLDGGVTSAGFETYFINTKLFKS